MTITVFKSLIMGTLALGLLHAPLAAMTTTTAPSLTVAAKHLKKLEACARGAGTAGQRAGPGRLKPGDLADPRKDPAAYRQAVARFASSLIYAALQCSLGQAWPVIKFAFAIMWIVSTCVLGSFGNIATIPFCILWHGGKETWPLIMVVWNLVWCIRGHGDVLSTTAPSTTRINIG